MTVTIRPLQENDRAPVIAMLKEGVALKHFLPTAYTQANALLGAALSGVPFTMIKLRAGQTRPHQVTSRAWVPKSTPCLRRSHCRWWMLMKSKSIWPGR